MQNLEVMGQKALNFNQAGYNCAQAVACAFSEQTGLEEKTLFKLAEGLGGGMGCYEGPCGALSGAILVLSYRLSGYKTKEATYKVVGELYTKFVQKFGSSVCKGLKEQELCSECIEFASNLAAQIFSAK
ncbi:MAG: C-GCAxxG-C-C family protein [Sphaerochaetaceae bacterium]